MNQDSRYGASKRLDESMRRADNELFWTLIIIATALLIVIGGIGAFVLWRYIL